VKAAIWTKYGPPDVLRIRDIPKPEPGDGEVLVRIVATSVFAGDCELRKFDFPVSFWLPLRLMFGLFKPRIRIMGQEFAGVIEAVGKNVEGFSAGDEVFAPTEASLGAYAEYLCLPSTHPISKKPANLSFAEAATIPVGGLNALHFLRKAEVRTGDKVLINGAGGGIGTIAIQLAKAAGATVTAVDHRDKLAALGALGADHVIDHTREDFTRNGERYDVIIDIAGRSHYSRSVRSLVKDGRYILGNPRLTGALRSLLTKLISGRRVIVAVAPYRKEDLEYLRGTIEAGKVRAVVDRTWPLDSIAEAHAYVDSGKKTGSVAIIVAENTNAHT
jgi:NADPH:quinone reductase-like Zn-dependent oxidoreductase